MSHRFLFQTGGGIHPGRLWSLAGYLWSAYREKGFSFDDQFLNDNRTNKVSQEVGHQHFIF